MDRSYRFIWAALMIAAVGLTGTTVVFSYLTSVSAESIGCAGQDILSGYHRVDIWRLALFSLVSLAPIAMARNEQRVADVFANYDAPVFEFASLRITFGAVAIYSSLLVFVACIGFMTMETVARYSAISAYPLAKAGPSATIISRAARGATGLSLPVSCCGGFDEPSAPWTLLRLSGGKDILGGALMPDGSEVQQVIPVNEGIIISDRIAVLELAIRGEELV